MRLCFLYGLLILLTSVGCQSHQHRYKEEAKQGEFNLRTWGFSRSGAIRLDGNWKFTWLDTIKGTQSTSYIQVPGSWNSLVINGKKILGKGTGIYELTLHLRPEEVGQIVDLRLPIISCQKFRPRFVCGT